MSQVIKEAFDKPFAFFNLEDHNDHENKLTIHLKDKSN